jgi:uncharacterized UBP type Zn finger protein
MSTRQLLNKQNTFSHTEKWKIHVLIFGINIHKTTTQQKTKIQKQIISREHWQYYFTMQGVL